MIDVTIVEREGRRPCGACGGDIGAACDACGGCGSIAPDLTCPCGRTLERNSWHEVPVHHFGGPERLPKYFCADGHQVAIRFLPVAELEQGEAA